MDDQMFVKPSREGLIVRDPVSLLVLPAEGALKPRSSFWVRRLNCGDVIEVEAAPPASQDQA